MKITFLLAWAYGMGGLVRTTVNTANHFAEQGHDVKLITFFRHRDEPFFDIRSDVEIETLLDTRKNVQLGKVEAWERARPSILTPRTEQYHDKITLRGDLMLARAMRSLDADVLISTRPAFNLAAAMWAPKHTLLIGQDHLNYTNHDGALRWQMKQWYPRLDAMVTLTEADRADYQRLLQDAPTTVRAIGNAVTRGPHPQTTQTENVVVTAGRLSGQKRYDHMITAFAEVVAARPEWTLRIFGDGTSGKKLQALINDLGVGDHIKLMGRTTDTEGEFAKASIMAMSSRLEGFPMVILEAFACGLPVVSYDCPRGPGEMITTGHDGLVVKNSDPHALAEGLLQLIDDPELRRTMSKNALATAERNSIDVVGARWEELFAELRTNRAKRPARPIRAVVKRRVKHAIPRRAPRAQWT